MDLTPPLTRSPASPPNSYCPSDRSSLGYPSPDLVAQQYKITTIYGAPCSMAPPLDSDTSLPPLPPLDAMGQPEWNQPTVIQTTSTGSVMPSIVSSGYAGFGSYEAATMGGPASYGNDVYSPHSHPHPHAHSHPHARTHPHGHHHAQSHHHSHPQSHPHANSNPDSAISSSPPPHSRSPIAAPSRNPLSYSPGTSLTTPRTKIEGTQAEYGQGIEVAHYPSPRSVQAPYPADTSNYPPPSSGYLSDTQSSVWSKDYHSADPDQFYPSPAGQPVGFINETRRPFRAHRPRARKRLTTKEEANFQCEVKGCGKLFSRSYNFKAHMETHDDKREYPFPCPVNDCNKKFVRKTDLQRHHQSVHMKERNHKCDYCGRLFARKDTLRRHMEDGCSKRFDIGTLDLRADSYDSMGSGVRSVGTTMSHLVPTHGSLPPMSIPPIGNSGMLAPVSATMRTRDMLQSEQHHSQHSWGR